MTGPHRASRRRRSRGARRLALAITLVLIALVTACSDAPTAKEIEKADDGVDPSVVTVLAPKGLQQVVVELGARFSETTRGIAITYVPANDSGDGEQFVGGYRPSMWIDAASELAPYLSDPKASGAPARFGETPLMFAVHEDLAGVPRSLAVFGSDASPLSSGLCEDTAPCGIAAREALGQAGVEADPDLVRPDGRELITALSKKEVDAVIVYRNDVARVYSIVDEEPLPIADPTIGQIEYQSLVFGRVPVAAEFQRWIVSSPDAAAVLARFGFLPRDESRA